MSATSARATIANAERATSSNSGPRHVSAPVFSRRMSDASSVVPIIPASGDRRHASRATHLLAVDAQLDPRGGRPQEQGNRPVENDPKTAFPPRHLKQVIRPTQPPCRKTGEPY